MRRITIWITATLAVAGLLFAFQLNASGTTGKSGDDGNHTQPGATASARTRPSPATTPLATANTSASPARTSRPLPAQGCAADPGRHNRVGPGSALGTSGTASNAKHSIMVVKRGFE
ncbi:hypothetical protein ABZS95_40235 [Streptomyces sp. NPDC005479]|uniref:hypothetical protein n=1 Tax=unclassified Streptomyces TaxID=2593676 RepID=UPI0033BCB96B